MIKNRRNVVIKLEYCMKIRGITKPQLAEKWKKSKDYIYRRFSGSVDFSLTDIKDLIFILNLSEQEAIDIFLNNNYVIRKMAT